jgi:hypothetical protein
MESDGFSSANPVTSRVAVIAPLPFSEVGFILFLKVRLVHEGGTTLVATLSIVSIPTLNTPLLPIAIDIVFPNPFHFPGGAQKVHNGLDFV